MMYYLEQLKTDYDIAEGGIQTLSTSGSFTITDGVEYTLNLKTLLSGSLIDENKSIRAYFSGSNYEQKLPYSKWFCNL